MLRRLLDHADCPLCLAGLVLLGLAAGLGLAVAAAAVWLAGRFG